ncbi:MAG: methyltransferase [Bacteroidaceae bacterium]|nr:methyltransferase [Bacteroidaceae bacterium]
MTNEKTFRFKQFTVRHDRCAMKVGTDGVLLGAWANVKDAKTALDIGTGTGLIALMLAQRNAALHITGIDIDLDAVVQAKENVADSPWSDRIVIKQENFNIDPRLCQAEGSSLTRMFDLIVSNPPFFTENTLNPDAARTAARHACSLPIPVLIQNVATMLTEQGRFCLIVPTSIAQEVIGEAATHHLYLSRRTDVKTTPRKAAKRTLLEFTPNITNTDYSTLTLQNEHQQRTSEYRALTQDFYST